MDGQRWKHDRDDQKGSEILMEAPMNAGTYTVEVHTEAGKNYEAGSQTFSFEIKKLRSA